MNSGPSIERRMVLRLIEHWDNLRQDRQYPAPEDLNPAEGPLADFWQDCFTVVVASPPNASKFTFIGGNLLETSHLPTDWQDSTARVLSDCPENSLLGQSVSYVRQVLDKKVPISLGDSFPDGEYIIRFRSIVLPMSSDGETVDQLFGAANCLRVGARQTELVEHG